VRVPQKTVCSAPTDAQKVTSQSDTTTLLGSSRRDYYNILKWMSLANSDLLPAIGGVILPLIGRHLAVRKNSEDCLRAFYMDCKLLENHLQKNKYLIGDQLTLADFFTVGMLVFAFMVFHKVLHAEYPRLTEWFNEIYETPMFKDVTGDLHLLDVPFPTLPEHK
jgi:elongation factor 1-gamma